MMRKLLTKISSFALLLAVFCALIGLNDYQRFARSPLQLEQAQTVIVAPGTSLGGLLRDWDESGWIGKSHDIWWLRMQMRLQRDARPIQAGEYELRPGRSLASSIAQLQRGEIKQYEFTILEGWTFRQLRQALQNTQALHNESANWSDAKLMQALGRQGSHPEGRFLPETYAYVRGDRDLDLLKRAADAMDQALQQSWAMRAAGLPLKSPQDALILASIVEKETGRADERARIAGVFTSRLRKRMRLQTDPTVIYGLGEQFDGNLRRRDLRTDTPYNTYTRRGLPPTPIALPGRAALLAAVQPDERGELYFVSRGDGSHKFSATLREHQQAVRRYQLKR